jgi:hypothetical protein
MIEKVTFNSLTRESSHPRGLLVTRRHCATLTHSLFERSL